MNFLTSIEIFPAEKTCEQGCSTCPMARKDNVVIATVINPDVQESLSILEGFLLQTGKKHDVHFTATPNLFPTFRYPELIRMARFETKREVDPITFSSNVEDIVRAHSLHPTTIGFSVVPEYPVIGSKDSERIQALIEGIGKWYFTDTETHCIEATVRSNLVPSSVFDEVLPRLFASDEVHLKSLIESKRIRVRSDGPKTFDILGGRMYANEYTGRDKTRVIKIMNRVITGAKAKKEDRKEFHRDQAQTLYHVPFADFGIAPRGVMLNHASLAINNPIMWMSHEDFRTELRKECSRSDKPSALDFARRIILENQVMYNMVFAHNADIADTLKFEEYLDVFFAYRKNFI